MSRLQRLVLGLTALVTTSMALPLPTAQACNPYESTLAIGVGPENPIAGKLFYNVSSMCTNHPFGDRPACSGSFSIPPFTAIGTKCNQLANSMLGNTACAPFVITNNCSATTPSIKMSDPGCTTEGTAGDGLVFGIANDGDILKTNPSSSEALVDYESDRIVPGCTLAGNGDTAILKGTALGIAISGQTAGVTASAVTASGTTVTAFRATVQGEAPTAVLTSLATTINGQLVQGLRCDVASGRVLQCRIASTGRSTPTLLQNNDRGFIRGNLAGPPAAVAAVVAKVDTPSAPVFTDPVPPAPSQRVPALDDLGRVLLGGMLLACAMFFVWMRNRRRGYSVQSL